jgi:hypothetical protein
LQELCEKATYVCLGSQGHDAMSYKVYAVKGFKGVWPEGTAAVVVARSRYDAERQLVDTVQTYLKLSAKEILEAAEFTVVNPSKRGVIILNDGDY